MKMITCKYCGIKVVPTRVRKIGNYRHLPNSKPIYFFICTLCGRIHKGVK